MSDIPSAIESANLGAGGDPNLAKPEILLAKESSGWLEGISEWFGDHCSSILVKETRQAVKSKQFIWSYIALLVAVGVWTMFALALSNSEDAGRTLLVGYFWILGFPLGIIIPFSAYRSLAREFEDGTIQLISITTMRPYQVVVGKFGSAILQMLIFLSVLAPCVMFTYMLRGLSIDTLILGLGISIGGSICLTIVGLFLAGAFRSKTLGVGVSVLFVLALGFAYFGWCAISAEMTWYASGIEWDDASTEIITFGIIACLGSTAALLLVAAASQISFPSDNRSTPVRIMMVVQQMLFFAFFIIMLPSVLGFSFDEALVIMLFVTGHYWLIMGFLMSGEAGEMSRRVKRTLPTSWLAKSMFALFMPGAGRGYLFAVANVWSCGIAMSLLGLFGENLVDAESIEQIWRNRGMGAAAAIPKVDPLTYAAIIVHCIYVTCFLSINFLLMQRFLGSSAKEWKAGTGPLLSLFTGFLLVAIISTSTLFVHFNFYYIDNGSDMSPILLGNWYYTTMELGFGSSFPMVAGWSLLLLAVMLVPMVLAILIASRELLHQRVKVPERVAIENQKSQERLLPAGESIEEIFGELKPPASH